MRKTKRPVMLAIFKGLMLQQNMHNYFRAKHSAPRRLASG